MNKIRKDMETGKTLEKQYKENSNKYLPGNKFFNHDIQNLETTMKKYIEKYRNEFR